MLPLFRLTPAPSRAPLISRLNSPTCLQPSNSASRPSNSFDLRSLSTFPSRSNSHLRTRYFVLSPIFAFACVLLPSRARQIRGSWFLEFSHHAIFSYRDQRDTLPPASASVNPRSVAFTPIHESSESRITLSPRRQSGNSAERRNVNNLRFFRIRCR